MDFFEKEKPRLGGEARNNRDNHNSSYLSNYKGFSNSAAEIAAALNGRKTSHGWLCRCPAHDDNSPSLSIKSGDGSRLILYCHAGCSYKDITTALKSLGLIDSKEYTKPTLAPKPALQNQNLDWSAKAEFIWGKSTSLKGSVAEVYLLNRGCAIPTGNIRFLPAYKNGYPAMVAKISDAITSKPISLHFTYLMPDGSGKAPIETAKKTLFGHRIKGGIIRLTDDDKVTTGLGIAEGIETALSIAKSGWHPIWAAGNKNNIANLPVLDGIESLTIFADNDKAGLEAATTCATRWLNAGREVKIVPSPIHKTDWNDVCGRVV